MKYRLKYHDTTWLFFTPFAFLNMGGTDLWTVECKKHWWNKWEIIERYNKPEPAHIRYFKLKHNLDINEYLEFPHNRNKNKKQTCKLTFKYNDRGGEYKYGVGYKPNNYIYTKFYHICYSPDSYEDALMKLWCDLEIQKTINKDKSLVDIKLKTKNLEKESIHLKSNNTL